MERIPGQTRRPLGPKWPPLRPLFCGVPVRFGGPLGPGPLGPPGPPLGPRPFRTFGPAPLGPGPLGLGPLGPLGPPLWAPLWAPVRALGPMGSPGRPRPQTLGGPWGPLAPRGPWGPWRCHCHCRHCLAVWRCGSGMRMGFRAREGPQWLPRARGINSVQISRQMEPWRPDSDHAS